MNITIERPRSKSDADVCRENGWGPGTLLAGCEGYGECVIKITAVGERGILARCVKPHDSSECNWTLSCRNWHKVDENYVPKPEPIKPQPRS